MPNGSFEMRQVIPINLAFEDELSEAVLGKILQCSGRNYQIGDRFHGHGAGFLKKRIKGFNQAARGMPYLILTDLDTDECAPLKLRDWLPVPASPNLIFRIAVCEVESWILADQENMADFLGVERESFPVQPDAIPDPKQLLVNLARASRKRTIRQNLVPKPGSTAKVGPAYNKHLCEFVQNQWDPLLARSSSPSLMRAVKAIESFQPVWQNKARIEDEKPSGE